MDADEIDSADILFHDWQAIDGDLSLYDRVLISVVAISYAQYGSSGKLKEYLNSIKPEMKLAFKSRADQLLTERDRRRFEELKGEKNKSTWVEAARYGISTYLNDFSNAQIESFRSLDEYVRKKTSITNQVFVTFGVALALAILVGAIRPAVTIWDDIKSQFSAAEKD